MASTETAKPKQEHGAPKLDRVFERNKNKKYSVRRSGLGVVSWTCDPVPALGQSSIPTPSAHSAAIPLGKGFTVHYLVFSDGT